MPSFNTWLVLVCALFYVQDVGIAFGKIALPTKDNTRSLTTGESECSPELCKAPCTAMGVKRGREFKRAYCQPNGECGCEFGSTLKDCDQDNCTKACENHAAGNRSLEVILAICVGKACQCKLKLYPSDDAIVPRAIQPEEEGCGKNNCTDVCKQNTPADKKLKTVECVNNSCNCVFEEFLCNKITCKQHCVEITPPGKAPLKSICNDGQCSCQYQDIPKICTKEKCEASCLDMIKNEPQKALYKYYCDKETCRCTFKKVAGLCVESECRKTCADENRDPEYAHCQWNDCRCG